jgi:hypothetical protein
VAILSMGVVLMAANFYFYHFYSAHIVDHSVPATGNIHPVGMNGRMIFSYPFAELFCRRHMVWIIARFRRCLLLERSLETRQTRFNHLTNR